MTGSIRRRVAGVAVLAAVALGVLAPMAQAVPTGYKVGSALKGYKVG